MFNWQIKKLAIHVSRFKKLIVVCEISKCRNHCFLIFQGRTGFPEVWDLK